MHKMTRISFWLGALLAVTTVQAAEDGAKKAAQLLEKHYYESAAALLRTEAGRTASPGTALTLARAYARNAELYRLLQASSLNLGSMHLKKLVAQRGRDRSRYAPLYYGEYLLQSGQSRAALSQLGRFSKTGGVDKSLLEIAGIDQAMAQRKVAADGKSGDALVQSQWALARSASAGQQAEAAKQADTAIAALPAQELLPVRVFSNAVSVYARANQADKAFALYSRVDMGAASYEETVNKAKVLRFYDPGLLAGLAELYQGEAERWLMKVKDDAKYRAIANYFLLELYLGGDQMSKAAAVLQELRSASDLPAVYKDRVAVMQVSVTARSGKGKQAKSAFNELGKQYAQDPVMLAEVLSACVQAKASCSAVAGTARKLAATNQGEKFRSLHFAVGEQWATERKYDKALLEMETARDKSNKNRIDTNDPTWLARMADLYFASKSFSESLEIYFEMSKEFPAVRQLQETGQGVYSTEYRSAGDAKIF